MSQPGNPEDQNAGVRREPVVPQKALTEATENDRSPTKTDQELMPTTEADTTETTLDNKVEVIRTLFVPELLLENNDIDRSPTKTDRDFRTE